jgi:hypothetical protein
MIKSALDSSRTDAAKSARAADSAFSFPDASISFASKTITFDKDKFSRFGFLCDGICGQSVSPLSQDYLQV